MSMWITTLTSSLMGLFFEVMNNLSDIPFFSILFSTNCLYGGKIFFCLSEFSEVFLEEKFLNYYF